MSRTLNLRNPNNTKFNTLGNDDTINPNGTISAMISANKGMNDLHAMISRTTDSGISNYINSLKPNAAPQGQVISAGGQAAAPMAQTKYNTLNGPNLKSGTWEDNRGAQANGYAPGSEAEKMTQYLNSRNMASSAQWGAYQNSKANERAFNAYGERATQFAPWTPRPASEGALVDANQDDENVQMYQNHFGRKLNHGEIADYLRNRQNSQIHQNYVQSNANGPRYIDMQPYKDAYNQNLINENNSAAEKIRRINDEPTMEWGRGQKALGQLDIMYGKNSTEQGRNAIRQGMYQQPIQPLTPPTSMTNNFTPRGNPNLQMFGFNDRESIQNTFGQKRPAR